MTPNRRRVLVVAGFAALALALLHDATLSGGALFRRDLSLVWYPLVEAFVRCVAAGSWPVWDPWRGFGQPLLADPRIAVFYPPTWLNLVVAPWTYQTWFAFAHLVLAACGAHVLLRRLGGSPAGSFVAGCVWMASGPVVSLAGQFHHLAGASWMPMILAAGLSVLDRPDGRNVVRLALMFALQVFAGSPDYTAVTGLVLAALVVQRLRISAGRPARLAAVSAGVTLGLMLSAPQWLPTLAVARASARWDQPMATATLWSLHPIRLLELLLPLPWRDPRLPAGWYAAVFDDREPYLASIYCGVLSFVLAAAALLGRRRGLVALAAAAALLALGSHTPLYATLLAVLPPLRLLRYPEKAIVLTGLALALLAGLGFDALSAGRPEARRRARVAAAGALAIAGATLAALSSVSPGLARVALLGLLVLAALSLRLRATRQAALVAGLLALDLLASHHRLNPTAPASLLTTRPSPLAHLGPLEAARVYVYDYSLHFPAGGAERPGAERYSLARLPQDWRRDAALLLGVHDYLNPPTAERWGVRGSFDGDIVDLYPSFLKRLVERLREVEGDAAHARLLRLGGVSHVLTLHDASWTRDLTPLVTLPGLFREPIRVLGVPGPLPRAYVASGVRPASDEAAATLLTSAEFDLRREIVVAGAEPVPARELATRIEVARWLPDRIELAVRTDADGFLVLTESFDPGWRARVDGRPSPLLRANLAFRAVAVPKGEHRVEMRYRPPGLVLGASLSAAAVVLLALAWRRRG